VIHAVGPRWSGGGRREAELLANAYRHAMQLAAAHHCRSVAFPAISTGIYGYPLEEATTIAVATVRGVMAEPDCTVHEVIFACFDESTMQVYQSALR
jgi:O-acetyl-ADP-ribose deacetylase